MIKKVTIILLLAIFASVGFAVASNLPATGELVINTDADIKVTVNSDKVTVEVPVLSDQIPLNTKWHLHESHAVSDGVSKWPLDTAKDYSLNNTVRNGNTLTATIDLQNANFVWYRIWGSDNQKWLYINQASPYNRLDEKGKPGYEFVVDTKTGEVYTVPNNYDTRP